MTDASYESAIPLALATPNVFVARTFSKAYGMAGMRIGYAIGRAETIKPLATLKMPYNVSVFGVAAAIASLGDSQHIADERERNTKVRDFTVQAFVFRAIDHPHSAPADLFQNPIMAVRLADHRKVFYHGLLCIARNSTSAALKASGRSNMVRWAVAGMMRILAPLTDAAMARALASGVTPS